ncbi:dipeptidase [soil metagenome]
MTSSGQNLTAGVEGRAQIAALSEAVDAGFPASLADLSSLVRIPSVSAAAFDPRQVARSADAVAALARDLGVFDRVTIERAPIGRFPQAAQGSELGQPAVLASRAARNGKPTILLYAHHDVQPPGRNEDWQSAPFEPTVRGGRIYGRGAADDKAGVMAHISAIRALTAVIGRDVDLGISLFVEGEEEFGSRSFANFLELHRDRLSADVIVVADSDNWDTDTPALTVGLRGTVALRLTVRTLAHASHSGMFGGAVPDAMMATIGLLSTLWSDDGSVAVTGMSSDQGAYPDYSESQLRAEAGLLDGVSPIGSGDILGRIWSKPAITVTGIDAPSVVTASNTLTPAVTVRVSARVAPGQAAAEARAALEAHLLSHAPFGAEVVIDEVDVGDGIQVDTSGWAVAEVEQAMADAWGRPAVEMGVGGSIPFIADLVGVFPEAQILVTGVEDPDSRAHSPNESLHLGVFRRAILTEALLLARLDARD